ncbi:MAG: hypothetical protein H6Q14_2543 [Bacteroidetes bacterium]|nr:hypothetical protein [Bacteroidota bacterium]
MNLADLRFYDEKQELKFAINFSFGVGQGMIGIGSEFLGIKGAPWGHSGYDLSISLSFDTDKKTLSLEGSAGYNQTKSSFGGGFGAYGRESSIEKVSEAKFEIGFNFTEGRLEAKSGIEMNSEFKNIEKFSIGGLTNTETDGKFSHSMEIKSIGIKKFDLGVGVVDAHAGLNISLDPATSLTETAKNPTESVNIDKIKKDEE